MKTIGRSSHWKRHQVLNITPAVLAVDDSCRTIMMSGRRF